MRSLSADKLEMVACFFPPEIDMYYVHSSAVLRAQIESALSEDVL